MHVFRIELFGHGRKTGHICKEHGDQFSFSLDGRVAGEDLVSQELGRVSKGLALLPGRGCLGTIQSFSTLVAKDTVCRVRLAAGRAQHRHRMAALIAGPGSFQIVCIAGKTFHKLRFTCMRVNLIKRMIRCRNDRLGLKLRYLHTTAPSLFGPPNHLVNFLLKMVESIIIWVASNLAKITLFSCPL